MTPVLRLPRGARQPGLEYSNRPRFYTGLLLTRSHHDWVVLGVAAVVFLGTIVSPPSLMDDVDSAYAQIARTMLESGDWVTARLNGVAYFDKPPGQVWAMAAAYAVFGVHDWSARLPTALACIALAWVTMRFGRWAFGGDAGLWSGLAMATSIGMWLFSRVRIPDPALTLAITIAVFAAARLIEGDARRPRAWSVLLGASLGVGLLFKGLPALVFSGAAVGLWLLFTGRALDEPKYVRRLMGKIRAFYPMFLDPQQVFCKRVGFTQSTQVAVFDAAGVLLYRGPVDDGLYDEDVTRFYLEEVLDALHANKPIPMTTAKAEYGCNFNDPASCEQYEKKDGAPAGGEGAQ